MLGVAVLTAGVAQAAPKPAPAPYTLSRVVVEQDVSLVNMQSGSGDSPHNPVTGVETRPVTVDCPARESETWLGGLGLLWRECLAAKRRLGDVPAPELLL